MRLSALNRKLLRDLRAMRSQAIAIALVVAAGITLYVTYLANFHSLRTAQESYYQTQRFADVFAALKRAPMSVVSQIAGIPGVDVVEARVVAQVTINIVGLDQPASARLVSIPAARRPSLNDLVVRRGRWVDADHPEEVLASEGFVDANGFKPGDRIPALINGRLRSLTIVGVALSPEFVYSSNPGELVPDDRRYGVLWMNYSALSAAFDMAGAFNDVSLTLERNANVHEVLRRLDAVLASHGGRGGIPRSLQYSDWMLQNELRQLESVGLVLPAIFLCVAAFVMNVALARALTLQRPQIAALKALGYTNASLAWHYSKSALMIATGGLVAGIVGGSVLGEQICDVYNRYFRFPNLTFAIPLSTLLTGAVFTCAAAAAGALSAVRNAVRVPPAEAMRPEAPANYRVRFVDQPLVAGQLGVVGRMVARNIARRPVRALASIAGVSAAVALLMVGMVMFDAMDRLIETQFWVSERQDASVSFVEPQSSNLEHELQRLPGVMVVEPTRSVTAKVTAGHRSRQVGVIGVEHDGRLQRIVDSKGRTMPVPPSGVTLSGTLADVLHVAAGDTVTLATLEGHRASRDVRVHAIVDDTMGLSVYMERSDLHRLMREPRLASGALMLYDPAQESALLAALRQRPDVAGVTLKRGVLRSFRDTMAATMDVTLAINLLFAAIIAVGVVYNAARVSLSERSHELASLRVLGYTRTEISTILLGELAVLALLALPIGWLFGYWLALALFATVQSEVYRFPIYISPRTVAQASLGVLACAAVAALAVRRRLDRLDLIAVLKVRE